MADRGDDCVLRGVWQFTEGQTTLLILKYKVLQRRCSTLKRRA